MTLAFESRTCKVTSATGGVSPDSSGPGLTLPLPAGKIVNGDAGFARLGSRLEVADGYHYTPLGAGEGRCRRGCADRNNGRVAESGRFAGTLPQAIFHEQLPEGAASGQEMAVSRAAASMQPMDLSEAQALSLQQALASGAARPKIRISPLPEFEG